MIPGLIPACILSFSNYDRLESNELEMDGCNKLIVFVVQIDKIYRVDFKEWFSELIFKRGMFTKYDGLEV